MNIWDCKKLPLTELLSTIVDNRGKTVPTVDKGRILIATNCVTNQTLFPVYEKVRYISDEVYKNWFRAHPIPGDIIFVNKGTPGRVCMVPDPIDFSIAQDMIALRADNTKIYNKYLFAVLRTERIQRQIYNTSVGDVIPHFKKQFLDQIQIPIPDRKTQEFIGDLYYNLSFKIEHNNRINHNLEEQAQALYKSWFEDFEPFKNGEFIESELGMIPSALTIRHISDIPHILETGRRPKGGVGELSTGVPSIGAESIKGLGYFDSSKVKYISDEFASTLKKGWIDGYELLIYKDGGTPGYFIPNYNIFGEAFPFERMCLNEHVFKLDFRDRGINAFAYFYFHTDYVFNYLNAQGGKAAIPGINQKDIESLWIYDPSNEYVQIFAKRISPMITAILKNCKSNMKLIRMRDILLPKLMSGELNINEIEC